MKKKLLSLIAASAMIITSFAACNDKTESSSGGNTTSAPEGKTTTADGGDTTSGSESEMDKTPVTLKVWESLDGPDEFIKQAGEKFTEKYPWITIEFVNVELGDSTTQIAVACHAKRKNLTRKIQNQSR